MHMLLILVISFLGLVFIPKTQGLSIAQLSYGSETGSGDVSISFTTISVASTTTTTTATNTTTTTTTTATNTTTTTTTTATTPKAVQVDTCIIVGLLST